MKFPKPIYCRKNELVEISSTLIRILLYELPSRYQTLTACNDLTANPSC
jgi:hypothetical protein